MSKALAIYVHILAVVMCMTIGAQTTSAQTADKTLDEKQISESELQSVESNLEAARLRQQSIRAEIEALDQDVAAINRVLIETAKRGQRLEAEITQAEKNLTALTVSQQAIRKSLQGKKALLSEVLAALQRMSKNPPPALLVRPEDALASVRSAIVLGAVVPEVRTESRTLLQELQVLSATTRKVEDQKMALAKSLNSLSEDESRLSLLVEQKNKLMAGSRENLAREEKVAIELATKAKTLKELIESLETQLTSAAEAADAARRADSRRNIRETERLAKAQEQLQKAQSDLSEGAIALRDGALDRLEPAIAFSKASSALPKPVSGDLLYEFGSLALDGSKRAALALSTRPNARVRSPADSWVVYAGPFRSYGQLIILNAGEGYHIVLAGLSEATTKPGRFVLAGEPIGRMGARAPAALITPELGSNKPVLTVEFRKDGKPIDPSPWWSNSPEQDSTMSPLAGAEKGPDNDS